MFTWNLRHFSFWPIVSCSVTGHHSSHHVLIHIDKIPLNLPFFRLNSPSSQRLLVCRMLQALNYCHGWTFSGMSMFLLYWGVQDWTQHSRHVSPVLSRGEGPPLLLCWQQCAQCSVECRCRLCCEGPLIAHGQLGIHQYCQVLLCKAAFPPTSSQPVFLPKWIT